MDHLGWQGQSYLQNVDQYESLKRSNPELVFHEYVERSNYSFGVNTSKAPFNDIRVRQAMQLSLDLETIKNTYSGLTQNFAKALILLTSSKMPQIH